MTKVYVLMCGEKNLYKFSDMNTPSIFTTLEKALSYAKKCIEEEVYEIEENEDRLHYDTAIGGSNLIKYYSDNGLPDNSMNYIASSYNGMRAMWIDIVTLDPE